MTEEEKKKEVLKIEKKIAKKLLWVAEQLSQVCKEFHVDFEFGSVVFKFKKQAELE